MRKNKFWATILVAMMIGPIAALASSDTQALTKANRHEVLLEKGWKFHKGDVQGAENVDFNDSAWESVCVPHDWAIKGPFSEDIDLQVVAITQDGETAASKKTGRTGGLPYIGVGWYRREFTARAADCTGGAACGPRTILIFDGAMSEAHVFVNGREICFWPYGYNSFWCDATDALSTDGNNVLAVRLENLPQSSRWYPGAGLYRNVHLLEVPAVHVPVWGTHITTPHIERDFASVRLETTVANPLGASLRISTDIIDPSGAVVCSRTFSGRTGKGQPLTQNFIVPDPALWSPENPALYKAVSTIYANGELSDTYETTFGIRSIEFIPEKGFFLNGERRKFQGVCNHHDLGPLGAAINVSALRHQLEMLKDMGCDAIRTSHNMPAPELVRLCDEMGFMMMLEPFDEWDIAKCANGYHRFFNEWAEKDMVNMLHQYRNAPSVVIWSIGNEVPTQCSEKGYEVACFLRDICHREDPTRPITCGMDQVSCVLENGFAQVIDIPGLNYRDFRYLEAYECLPHGFILGSETASTVSARGVYHLPVEKTYSKEWEDGQSSSYDFDACSWSNLPDLDFALAEDYEWTMGQFVWTGFDYLGEPSPFGTDFWPNHSSMFGIIDLASIPKDRYYLYRSMWNHNSPTLHVLPHWNWSKGQNVPVFVYTSYPSAELFVNGVSQGRLWKESANGVKTRGETSEDLERRFRLMWNDVTFEPGEVKVVAYDASDVAVDSAFVRTAGKPHHIELSYNGGALTADGKDLAYVTARVVDAKGVTCPDASSLLNFKVTGAAHFKAVANGDARCLEQFHLPQMHAFHGMLTVIVESSETPGNASLTVSGKGLRSAKIGLEIK